MCDPYKTLGLDPLAPKELVDEAYWLLVRLASRLPANAAAARTRELTAAYEVLATTERRAAYDQRAHDDAAADPGAAPRRKRPLDFRTPLGNAPGRGGHDDYGDYYNLLRVDVEADPVVIDLALRIMTPRASSRNGGGQPARETLDNARQTLLAPELRAAYDAQLRSAAPMRFAGSAQRRAMTATMAPPGAGTAHRHARLRPGLAAALPAPLAGATHTPLEDDLSARRVMTGAQKGVGIALVMLTLAGLAIATMATLIGLISIAATSYMASMVYKAYLAAVSFSSPHEVPIEPDDISSILDEALPVYTVILPVFRESNVLGALVRAIEALDYPKEKLDVKLLLEEDDAEMHTAIAAMNVPSYIETLIVPDVGPQGKPRACNYGLAHARGPYLALYDAEDRPQPDQLKKALVAFAKGGQDVACVQAKLDFYNADQNLLTKWFTIEYSTWFNLYLPALNSLGGPIPLGGTSNHFRVQALRSVGAWDAYNVTEDADLGVRLARRNFKTLVIDSVTYEEANSRLGNWLRQRSRWAKGYMQTWLVHMRHPFRLYSELGAAGFLSFQVMVFGTFSAYFLNPVFWGLLVVWYVTESASIQALHPGPLLFVSAVAFLGGNFLFIFTAIAGALRRGFYHGVKYALASHVYWALMSLAAWKALFQLVVRPHYWEKTEHGLDAAWAGEGVDGAR